MDPTVIAVFVNAGIGGVVLYLFIRDVLVTKKSSDERVAEVNKAWSGRFNDMKDQRDAERTRGDEWRTLALGNEQRLDSVTPIVREAVPLVAAARESVVPSAAEPGRDLIADSRRADQVRSRRRTG